MDSMTTGIESLQIREPPRLQTLPVDVVLIILGFIDTAHAIAGVSSSCRTLHRIVKAQGWRIFVRTRFESLKLPQVPDAGAQDVWEQLARTLTWQSWAWDRRALALNSYKPRVLRESQPGQRHALRRRPQTVDCHVIVDAHMSIERNTQTETVVWGAGEDIVARVQRAPTPRVVEDQWFELKGSSIGLRSGIDDVTAISVVDDVQSKGSRVVVGRASGDLRLLSLDPTRFGQTLTRFQPLDAEDAVENLIQSEVQSLDLDSRQNLLAAGTKEDIILYQLDPELDGTATVGGTISQQIAPLDAISIARYSGSSALNFVRSVKFMGDGSLAIGLNNSPEPLRYMTITPTGLELNTATKILPTERSVASYASSVRGTGTIRALLPIDARSIVGGGHNVLLSSYEDGTIRLQDIRTPSPVDTIYQDNFEPTTPVGAMVSYGLERFIAGSARMNVIKIFDFRWARPYHYTNAMPCGDDQPYPPPSPPYEASVPQYPDQHHCNHLLGSVCRWHALAKMDYYRPNTAVFMQPLQVSRPVRRPQESIYSMAKSSDISSKVFIGLAGELVEMGLGGDEDIRKVRVPTQLGGPDYNQARLSLKIVETGDGIALDDISRSQRMPEMRGSAASRGGRRFHSAALQKRNRLDEDFQWSDRHSRY